MKNTIIIGLVLFLIGGSIGYFYAPKQKEIVVKTVEVEKVVTKNDIKTVIKEVVNKDGSIEKTTEIHDNSEKQQDISKQSTSTTVKSAKDYHVSLALNDIKEKDIYTLRVEKRLFYEVFGGVSVTNKGEFGVSIGLSF